MGVTNRSLSEMILQLGLQQILQQWVLPVTFILWLAILQSPICKKTRAGGELPAGKLWQHSLGMGFPAYIRSEYLHVSYLIF